MMREAEAVLAVCRTVAQFSEEPARLTRTYLSPPTREVHVFLQASMARLGMESSVDAAGNLRGLRRGQSSSRQRLLLGSHIDTVPNAGAFDGVLGVAIALSLVEALEGHSLDYDIEIVAFSEEEGVRFGVPFIGSRALVGSVDDALLESKDVFGRSLKEAIAAFGLPPCELPQAALHADSFAYVEFHIEQGPVLEEQNTQLGIVEAVSGQSRYEITFRGQASHAGTTPMNLRQDALAGAAEWIVAVEREAVITPGLVATVGRVTVSPGAANVVPGEVSMSLDIRHPSESIRHAAGEGMLRSAQAISSRRRLRVGAVLRVDQPAVAMEARLTAALEAAALATGSRPLRMISGAGHDAMVIAEKIPAAMVFLRSPGGISHHPDETVLVGDVQAALDAGLYFLKHLDASAFVSPQS